MKRLILLLVLMLGLTTVKAEILWFKATHYAIKIAKINAYGDYVWSDWTDWEKCSVYVKMNTDSDLVEIFSNKKQAYRLVGEAETPYDDSGKQVGFKVVDQDGDIGTLRLRIQNNGTSQIYIDFADVKWVYNVTRVE